MPIINAAVAAEASAAVQAGCGAGGSGGNGGERDRPQNLALPRAGAPFGFLMTSLYSILTMTLSKLVIQGRNGTDFSFAEGHFMTTCRVQDQARHYRIRNTITGQTYSTIWTMQPQMCRVVNWFLENFNMCKFI